MTATAVDRLTVTALTPADARDKARWQWETFGFRVLRFVNVEGDPSCIHVPGEVPRWRVTAEVEVHP